MVASKTGALAAASAAPRASARPDSSGALTGIATRSCRCALTEATSTPEPTTNMPCGGESCASTADAMSASTAMASVLCRLRLSTLTMEPSSLRTTDSVAVSRSRNSSAGALVADRPAGGLGERACGVQFGDQDRRR